MSNRVLDWLKQADRDFDHARTSEENDEHEWACFAAHQAAEEAVKALHLYLGQEVWGHVVARLLKELPDHIAVTSEIYERAMVLDNYYIPSRYPDSHPEGAPFEHYGALQSKEAIAYAGEIIAFVRAQMA